MRYPDSVDFLYKLGNEIKSAKFGLEGMRILMKELGNPQDRIRTVHVAGTNGKGSTCAMIEAGLRENGLRTGLFTSPHLVEPTERIRIDFEPVSRECFSEAFKVVHEANERLIAGGALEHHTTYFETVSAMAFYVFDKLKVDTGVIEVGLGGRLDATNVIAKPELCVITRIDFDHEQFLGSSLESIAGEKAGILKPRVPAVIAQQRPEALGAIVKQARQTGSALVFTPEAQDVELSTHGSSLKVDGVPVRSPLAGEHQVENAVTACVALQRLGIREPKLEGAKWPGRLEYISRDPDIVLDGAHNPGGARALARYIEQCYSGRPVWIVFGAMRDKSVQEMTEILFPLAERVILTAPSTVRAAPPEAIREAADHRGIGIASSVSDALARARQAPPSTAVFITGSLYLVGEVHACL